ncbi:hypothetical protein [Granulicoccus phenolivorans]|uniref:hypothetical protein n=1 Tax=Granulicoccus phenolivorans TaxID=266854 RepID=UPI000415B83E|nr:hypothetical protein [Granulicoccus phenolivorans]
MTALTNTRSPGLTDLAGHVFTRLLYQDPQQTDCSTWVRWFQGRELHVDLRLGDIVEGFAGRTRIEDGVTCWDRLIDIAPTGADDRGRLRTEADGMILELGVEADYRELWQPAPHPITLELLLRSGDRKAVLLQLGPPENGRFALGTSLFAPVIAMGETDPDGWQIRRASAPDWVGHPVQLNRTADQVALTTPQGLHQWTIEQEWT